MKRKPDLFHIAKSSCQNHVPINHTTMKVGTSVRLLVNNRLAQLHAKTPKESIRNQVKFYCVLNIKGWQEILHLENHKKTVYRKENGASGEKLVRNPCF